MRNAFLQLKKTSVFEIFIFTLSFNLGLHFIQNFSYVRGILVDYAIPVIFVQDILVLVLAFEMLWFKKEAWAKIPSQVKGLLFVFLLIAAISAFFSANTSLSLFGLSRLALNLILFFYILLASKKNSYLFNKVSKILLITTIFLIFLGIAQWFNQGSIFNNYLIFGEQPYSVTAHQIAIENLFGRKVVGSYGLFKHPNIFGGFLSITLLWVLTILKSPRSKAILLAFGIIALFTTLSVTAWVSFILGLFFLSLLRRIAFAKSRLLILLITLVLEYK